MTHQSDERLDFLHSSNFKQKYHFMSFLGKGGFGVVVKVRKNDNQKEVIALKVIDKKNASKKYVRFLTKEASIHRDLLHPNIVKFKSVR